LTFAGVIGVGFYIEKESNNNAKGKEANPESYIKADVVRI